MTKQLEIKNAIIESVSINSGERDLLTVWVFLKYSGGGQGFGGYSLYLPKSYTHHTCKGDYAGHFLFRCMQIAGVEKWEDMKGKTVRVKAEHTRVHAIGHIVEEDWFCPEEDFNKMNPAELEP